MFPRQQDCVTKSPQELRNTPSQRSQTEVNGCSHGAKSWPITDLKCWFDGAEHTAHVSCSLKWESMFVIFIWQSIWYTWLNAENKEKGNKLSVQSVPAGATLNTSDISATDETCNICLVFHTVSFIHSAVHCCTSLIHLSQFLISWTFVSEMMLWKATKSNSLSPGMSWKHTPTPAHACKL